METATTIHTSAKAQVVTAQTAYEPKGIAAALNRFFHFKERGSTMSQEITAGISVFFLSACVLLMNTRIIGQALGADNAGYCGIYLAATIASFFGSLLIGLVCHLPLIQTASLGLSTAFVSLLGAGDGLTYQNLLAIAFISSVVYAAVVSIPAVRKCVYGALPAPVRKALPVGMGLYILFFALKDSGIISLSSGSVSVVTMSEMNSGMVKVGAIAAIVGALVCCICYRARKYVSAPVFYGLVMGLVSFYVVGLVIGFSQIFSVNRAYITVGAENMYTIVAGWQGLELGSVFTKGFDFSAYTGNVVELLVKSVLTFFFMSMYESEANIAGAALYNEGISEDKETTGRVLLCSAVTSAVGSVFGALPVTVAKQSAAASQDGGRSGLTSVTASVCYLLSMFTWFIFALLASYTATVSDYGHATSNSYAEYALAAFAVVDGVMFFVGMMLMKGAAKVNYNDADEFLPFFATVAAFSCTQNVVYGVAAGLLVYVITRLFSFDKKTIKSIGVPTAVLTALLVAVLAVL